MSPVGRYVRMTARPGAGEELAASMLDVARSLHSCPGCQLYLVNRTPSDPDVVWVTELWQSQEASDAALSAPGARESAAAVRELLGPDGLERIELEPLGGAGYAAGESGSQIVNLLALDDSAPGFGLSDVMEARFASDALGASTVGVSLQRLKPGMRQTFGHRHRADEEVYVVLAGSGRAAIDGALYELETLDPVRVSPGSTRAFEAGADGLTLLATGTRRPGDAEVLAGYWPEAPSGESSAGSGEDHPPAAP